ncbi:MAG: alpha/beta fold hydrolase [Solirubrobacteraceae bacterium]
MRQIRTRTLEFGILEEGSGPLALCLHGFPDTAHTWRHLLPELANAGFHAVAPFMRGYAPSALAGDDVYSLGSLVADAVALHEALDGDKQAVLIGHDWGAEATYGAGAFAPERFRKLVTLAIPPTGLDQRVFSDYGQLKRFWYMFFLGAPFAEPVVAADEMAFLARLWSDWSPGYDASEDLAFLKQSLSEPERLRAAIGYYRSNDGSGPDPHAAEREAMRRPAPQPTLYVHGSQDGCIAFDLARDAQEYLGAGSHVVELDEVGHFVQLEAPERVNRLILDWVTS